MAASSASPLSATIVASTLINDTFLRALLRQRPTTANLAHAPAGRYLPNTTQRARARQLLGLAKKPRLRDGGHASAARSLSARCGNPVLGHPDHPDAMASAFRSSR